MTEKPKKWESMSSEERIEVLKAENEKLQMQNVSIARDLADLRAALQAMKAGLRPYAEDMEVIKKTLEAIEKAIGFDHKTGKIRET
jgi:hypothetical protein